METKQLEMKFMEKEKVIDDLFTPPTREKKGKVIPIVKREHEIIGELTLQYTRDQITAMKKKGMKVSKDIEVGIYTMKSDYFNKQSIHKLRRAYVAKFNLWPMLPHKVY